MTFWNKLFGKQKNDKPQKKEENQNQNAINPIVEKYITGLKDAYLKNNGKEKWESFEQVIHGGRKEDINKLKRVYPNIPISLINLLEYVDGTYWRKYGNVEIIFFLLGSDMHEYPYYLLSTKEIIENQKQTKFYSDCIARKYEGIEIDDKITNKAESINWLHFSDCMNNGGTSQLYIDFSPSEKGIKGQIIRFVHDPDEFKVIANSFDEYLNMLIEKKFDFINEDTVE
ncbi:SMI1/KNR4 family protein [Flavobacteriaceae bacterium MHTCC 0001]